ncbi:hypothetical protein EVAR_65036_1 [Eumeta japonica]|uniref:G-protein coupled receptors family 1 profile domain-containing protein n=1 Tax=Eumeta variegata TaxID=151549 RepID=A0A4C1YR39_EUMVA|nr:hypothetical protein EVAR_65036_1 [Eumeta japonica]
MELGSVLRFYAATGCALDANFTNEGLRNVKVISVDYDSRQLTEKIAITVSCVFAFHRYTHLIEQSDAVTCLALLTHVLCYANSAVNPLIYNFMSGERVRTHARASYLNGIHINVQLATTNRAAITNVTRRRGTTSPGRNEDLARVLKPESGGGGGLCLAVDVQ